MQARSAWVIVGVVAGIVAGAWYVLRDDRVAVAPVQPVSSLPCEADAACVGRRHVAAAAIACRAAIEDLAGYRVRWAGAAPGFSRFAWRDRDRGVISFVGDEAEFENASGAFQPVTYECDFDPAAGRSLEARVRQGRLP